LALPSISSPRERKKKGWKKRFRRRMGREIVFRGVAERGNYTPVFESRKGKKGGKTIIHMQTGNPKEKEAGDHAPPGRKKRRPSREG